MGSLDDLMKKMCISESDGVGVEYKGNYYFYENFPEDDAISRAYRHFGTAELIIYSKRWAHQRNIKQFMKLYEKMYIFCEFDRAEKLAEVIAKYIDKWSGCGFDAALKQVKSYKVSYRSIV